MKGIMKKAFSDTIPVMTGYLVLGFGFGIVLKSSGYSTMLAFVMSLLIYAGSMQYAAISLLTGGASLFTAALTALTVNARHLFYGISMLERYRDTGWRKPYLIFALTDETYSLVCGEHPEIPQARKNSYYFLVSLLNQFYWVVGSVLGAVAGGLLHFNSRGIDFALTALFLTVFLEQWLSAKDHRPAVTGAASSIVCLLVFGSDRFLIPAMAMIAVSLCLQKEGNHD